MKGDDLQEVEIQRSQADPYLFSIPERLGGKKQIILFLTRSAVSNPLSELCLRSMEMKQKIKRLCGEALKRKRKEKRRWIFPESLIGNFI